MNDVQKLKQKSHSKSLEIFFGAHIITASLIPNLPISNMPNAAMLAIIAVKAIIIYISDITLLLLV